MLNNCTILNFDPKTVPFHPSSRANIVFIDIMNAAIARRLGLVDVVVSMLSPNQFVRCTGRKNPFAKSVEAFDIPQCRAFGRETFLALARVCR